MICLDENQIDAVKKLQNGSVLCAEVGTGKSRTALVYYYTRECGGQLVINNCGINKPMTRPRNLYVITTARKRDSNDWNKEAAPFGIFVDRQDLNSGGVSLTVDSWNNIKKYRKVTGAFFIFDEQRVTGSGPWVKAFLDITRKNRWILLSATPGDVWMDYVPLFIANGYFRNKTEFEREHVIFNRFVPYKKVLKYYNEGPLNHYRSEILVRMKDMREAKQHYKSIWCKYDKKQYDVIFKKRWNPDEEKPIENTAQLFYMIRKVVNSDPSRIDAVRDLAKRHERLVIFYNFTFELEALKALYEELGITYAEWNGETHEEIPHTDRWGYFVQYLAGSEAWNCVETNAMLFFSLNYSYRMTHQAEGRINRRNTPYKDLYYYTLLSHSPIDGAIANALKNKGKFNELYFLAQHKQYA